MSFIGGIFQPVVDLIDNLSTSDEERLELQAEIKQIENDFVSRILDYEGKLLELQSSIINSEIKGENWLQRNWRPIGMLNLLCLITAAAIGLIDPLPDKILTIVEWGFGGYIIGRSAEKIAKTVTGSGIKKIVGDIIKK